MAEAVHLKSEERDVALGEAQAVFALATDPGFRDDLARLLAALEESELDDGEVQTLEQLLELGLQAGRIRALYGPGGEQAALRLYRRLPRGSEAVGSAAAVSDALATLSGKRLESVRLDAVGPGSFSLAVSVDGADLSIRLDRQGARLASVGT